MAHRKPSKLLARPEGLEPATSGLENLGRFTNEHDSCCLVNAATGADTGENQQCYDAWGKTPGRNVPTEILRKCADRALAAYLGTLAVEMVKSLAVAA